MVVLLDSLEFLGGAETLAVDLALGLDPQRYRRTLFITRDQGGVRDREPQRSVLRRLREAGVEVRELRRSGRWSLLAWLPLLRYLRAERIEVLHAHKSGSNAWGVLWGKLAQVPAIVAHEHMWDYTQTGRLIRFVDRSWIARGADAFIAVSEEGRRQLIEISEVDPADVTYVPNGAPTVQQRDRAAAREKLGAGEDELVVGSVALLRPEKALHLLVEAGALLRERWPDLRVVIVGEGPERARLEALIAEREMESNVRLLGYRDDVPDLLPGLDVAVCCSRFEGGPLSVMEYMEAGVPVVATAVGGLPELLAEGRAGSLVEGGDAAALAAGVEPLLADPAIRSTLGEAGFERKRGAYSLEAWVERMSKLYDDLLSEKGLRP